MEEKYNYYGSRYADWEDVGEITESSDDEPFNILEDIDTVLFFRLNSFLHSVSNSELQNDSFDFSKINETQKLANDERTEFATGKISFFFHQMQDVLSPEQIELMRSIHRQLNADIVKVFEYFHQQTCQILSPNQVQQVRQIALDLINNVHIEMLRVRGIEVPGGEPDEHELSEVHTERQIIIEHVRHFLDRVEAIISLQQWGKFKVLTDQCKSWVHQELDETAKALNYVLSPEQRRMVQCDTKELKHDLSSIIEEYSIVKPTLPGNTATASEGSLLSNNGLSLALRSDINDILGYGQPDRHDTRAHRHNIREEDFA